MAAQVATTSSISSRASSVRTRENDDGSLRGDSTVGSGTYEGTNSLTSSVQIQEEDTFGSLEGSARSIATRSMGSRDGNVNIDVGVASAVGGGPSSPIRSQSRGGETNSLSNSLTSSMHLRGENSTCSSFGNELSLPSSFASSTGRGEGGAATTGVHSNENDSLQTHQLRSQDSQAGSNGNGGAMQVYDGNQVARGEATTVTSESESINSEDRLQLRISKETKPMMHLLRLLKEIDNRDGNSNQGDDPRSRAVASLMSDFEQEVNLIEHRIKDENLIMNGEQPPLPPNWIALEDPDSGDVYYANEATGETQWERPGLMGELQERMEELNMSASNNNLNPSNVHNAYDNDMQQSSMSNDYSRNDNLHGSNVSNNYERNNMQSSNVSNNFDGSQSNMQSSNMSNNFEGSRSDMNNTLESSLTDSNKAGNLNDSLPPDWIALSDPDSGEIYYANEVTGESTWDKPSMPHSSQQQDDGGDNDHDGAGDADDDDSLPPGWIALQDADSGDTYYLNQVTMATTWDKPGKGNPNDGQGPENDGHGRSDNDLASEHDGELPPGWEAILDPSSGDYYYAHEDGETQWERPGFDRSESAFSASEGNHDSSQQLSASGGSMMDGGAPQDADDGGGLPPGWFEAVDEQSGDKYFCNELTGETTWDFPTEPAITNDGQYEPNHSQMGEDGGGHDGGQGEGDDDLPPGWFAVADPASGDFYFCNEDTGETTWDRPTAGGAGDGGRHMASRSSVNDDTVYEDDSVTSSQY